MRTLKQEAHWLRQWVVHQGKCADLCSGVRAHISACANGKRKTAYGYIWKYED